MAEMYGFVDSEVFRWSNSWGEFSDVSVAFELRIIKSI